MRTICIDRNGNELYSFQGIAHREAEIMLKNDLRVWTYKIVNEFGCTVYLR